MNSDTTRFASLPIAGIGEKTPSAAQKSLDPPFSLLAAGRELLARQLRRAAKINCVDQAVLVKAAAEIEASTLSFHDMEQAFLDHTLVGVCGRTIFYKPRMQGSFREEKGRLAIHIKNYLVEHQLSHLWHNDLVNQFRDWIGIGAPVLSKDQMSSAPDLVD